MLTKPTIQFRPTVPVLGVNVCTLNLEGTVGAIDKMLQGTKPCLVVTADASGFAQAKDDPELQEIYEMADLVTPDSQGVVWALKRLGHKGAVRVSGVDLVDEICSLSANKGYRIYILGSAPGVAETAAERLRLRHPGCNIIGTRHGFFPAEDDELIAQEVGQLRPDVLFVAMGIPRQEKFIKRTLSLTGAKVSMGVGGSFDVFSGRTKRAPKFVQGMRLEWLWRLLLNPKKFHKVKMLPKFVSLVLRERKPEA